jgi:hypothetical protein
VERYLLITLLALGACKKPSDDGRSASQRASAKKTDEAAKKGALTEKLDPKKDLASQERNLERLHLDERGSRAAGNHAALWAIHWDERSAKKLIAKDRQLIAAGETKKDVEDPAAAKAVVSK